MKGYELTKATPNTYRLTYTQQNPGVGFIIPAHDLKEVSALLFSATIDQQLEQGEVPAMPAEIPPNAHDRKRLLQACWMAVLCAVAVWAYEITGVEYARNAALLGLWLFNAWIAASLLVEPNKLFVQKRDPLSQTMAIGAYLMVAVAGWWWTALTFFGVRLVNLIRYDRWRNARAVAAQKRGEEAEAPEQ
jgi:hypothetical protein